MAQVHFVYFSAAGTTRSIAALVREGMGCEGVEHDLLRAPVEQAVELGADDVAVFALPVYGGRIPHVCVDMLRMFRGQGTRAVAVVVYGNRAYDDALLELADIVSEQGFVPVAAAAFVAQHSLFPNVAAGRPDAADRELIVAFGENCAAKLCEPEAVRVEVPGKRPYVEAGAVSLHPSASSACNGCGTCVALCPTQAIDAASPRKTDATRCMACTACIAVCPQGARGFRTPIVYPLVSALFASKVKQRQEPEVFLG